MKKHFLFAMIGCVVLARGVSHGSDGNSNAETKPISQPTLNQPVPSGKNQTVGSPVKNSPVAAAGLPQPAPAQSVGPVPNKVNHVQSLTARPSVIQPAGPLLKDTHNHGAALPVIGGMPSAKAKTTAAISGTGINHKP